MVDWLMIWGATQAAGFLVKPILEDLAKDSARDYTKDFFKKCLKDVLRLPEKDEQKKAYGKALKEFLELVEQELDRADYQEVQIKRYIKPLNQFVKDEKVAAILGQAFEANCQYLDTTGLAQRWRDLNSPILPPGFNWGFVGKRYVAEVKKLIQKSEKLRPIFAAESQATVAESLQKWVGVAPEFDLDRHAEGLREKYGNLNLESLDTTGLCYNELKLWKIFVPQNVRECQEFSSQIHEVPKDHLRQLRGQGELGDMGMAEAELEQYRRVYTEQPIRSILEVVGDPMGTNLLSPVQYAVILGDPGSGKSTLLRYLALTWAERSPSELPLHPIPLLIELNTYARDKQEKKCNDILSFIHSGNIVCRLNQQQLYEKLRVGHAIALFDGVDEVFDLQLRNEVVTDIHRFTNEYEKVQAVVTSRWIGYKAYQLKGAEFRHFMLQDLEAEQIEDFIQRWHNLMFPEELGNTWKQERLQQAIKDSKAIRELAGNPLLLTMMAILNRNRELPRDRPELYNQASQVLLHQWDVERNLIEHRLDPMTIDYRHKQAMLRKVAYHMQSSEKGLAGNTISASNLESILTDYLRAIQVEKPRTLACLIITQLRTRNFILCYLGADSYAFVHRTFLEYFCACEIKERFDKRDLEDGLTFKQLQNEVFGRHWQDETWHEVLRLVAGMIDSQFAEKIIEFLRWRPPQGKYRFTNLFLAADCLKETKSHSRIQRTSEKLHEHIKWIATYIKNYLNDICDGNDDDYYEGYYHATTTLIQVIEVVGRTWRENSVTYQWLEECAQRGDYEEERWAAVRAISENYCNQSSTSLFLRELIREDQSGYVRGTAAWALAENYCDDPDTLLVLRAMVQEDEYESDRWIAAEIIAQFFPAAPGSFELLHKLITENTFEYGEDWKDNPRKTLLDTVVKNYPADPKALELLHDRALNDPNEEVRSFAKQQLAKLE